MPCTTEIGSSFISHRRLRSTGFTLLELLVVMVIIGLLAAYVGPKYFTQVGRSKVQVAQVQIAAFAKALEQYRIDTGRYPGTLSGLAALYAQPSNEPNWQGPYLNKNMPLDPWGSAYRYKSPAAEGREYEVVSYGADGTEGGLDDNADVISW